MEKIHYIDERLLTFCRYIKNRKTVAEIRIKDGSNHIVRYDKAIKNRIEFDYYFIYYKGEYSGKIDFGGFKKDNPFIALGLDKQGTQMYFFDSRTNEINSKRSKILQK